MSFDIMKLQNGSDVRGVAVAGVEGENVNLTDHITLKIGEKLQRILQLVLAAIQGFLVRLSARHL